MTAEANDSTPRKCDRQTAHRHVGNKQYIAQRTMFVKNHDFQDFKSFKSSHDRATNLLPVFWQPKYCLHYRISSIWFGLIHFMPASAQ